MVHFPAEEPRFTRVVKAQPDLLPVGWRGTGSRSLEIDVGCHKGRFLVEMARSYPFSNFLGVERQQERVEKTRKKISQLGLKNAAVVHGEGLEAIRQLPEACADYVHVLFPDPWPKRRHKIRRLVQTEFLRGVLRILKHRGILRIITDDTDYARAAESHAASLAQFQCVKNEGRNYPPTEFQIKFLLDSRPIYGLLLRRVS